MSRIFHVCIGWKTNCIYSYACIIYRISAFQEYSYCVIQYYIKITSVILDESRISEMLCFFFCYLFCFHITLYSCQPFNLFIFSVIFMSVSYNEIYSQPVCNLKLCTEWRPQVTEYNFLTMKRVFLFVKKNEIYEQQMHLEKNISLVLNLKEFCFHITLFFRFQKIFKKFFKLGKSQAEHGGNTRP